MAVTQPHSAEPGSAPGIDHAGGIPDAVWNQRWSRAARIWAMSLLALYLAAIAAVALALHVSRVVMRGNEITWDRAIFTAINAASLTGFQQTVGLREMSATGPVGPMLLLLLTVAGALTSLIVGSLAVARIVRLRYSPGQIVLAAIWSILLSGVGGAAVLSLLGRPIFESVFQSTAAFSNSGLWLGQPPALISVRTFLVLLPLAIVGGLGLPVLVELFDRPFGGPPLSRHARAVLALTAIFYLCGGAALVLAQASAALAGGPTAWRDTLVSCSAAAVNTRSAGLAIQTPAAFTVAGQWVLMLLMLIGASPAGTASGLKPTTLFQLARGVRDTLAGRAVHRICGIAAVWVIGYLLVLLLGIILLASLAPQPLDHLLFLACSALGNVGLSHDPVSNTGPVLLVLSALMLIGRLAPLAILWWTATTTQGVDVAVG